MREGIGTMELRVKPNPEPLEPSSRGYEFGFANQPDQTSKSRFRFSQKVLKRNKVRCIPTWNWTFRLGIVQLWTGHWIIWHVSCPVVNCFLKFLAQIVCGYIPYIFQITTVRYGPWIIMLFEIDGEVLVTWVKYKICGLSHGFYREHFIEISCEYLNMSFENIP